MLPSYEKLYKSGAIAYLQYQEEIKKAGINKINVEKQQKNLAAVEKNRNAAKAQLDLLQSGARQEDIDSARHSLEEAEAELSRIEQQIQYAVEQQKKGNLLMPLNGYLVTDHLAYKKGTYLKVGESFATAQDNAQPLVEVQLPEYNTEELRVEPRQRSSFSPIRFPLRKSAFHSASRHAVFESETDGIWNTHV